MTALTVELDLDVRITQRIDVVDYFATLADKPRPQADYASLDLNEWGCDEEWERPMVWLYFLAHDGAVPHSLIPGGAADGNVNDSTVSVAGRYGSDRHWTADDFYRLADAVDWIAEVYIAAIATDDRADRDPRDAVLATRVATRHHTPLFEIG